MLMALTGTPLWESLQPFSQGGSSPWSRSSMMRSAISSSTRCRWFLPLAGFFSRRLVRLVVTLVLVLVLGVLD